MLTEMTSETARLEAAASGADVEVLLEEQRRAVPLGRFGTAAELGEMVAWIASDASSFTTGASSTSRRNECLLLRCPAMIPGSQRRCAPSSRRYPGASRAR